MILLLACAHAPAPPQAFELVGARLEWFDIEGGDRVDMLLSCYEECPRDDAGTPVTSLTTWSVDWTWQRRPYDPCEVLGATVAVDVRVALPRWEAPPDADPALVEEWSAYLGALVRHEQGHVDVVHAMARGTEAALTAAGCSGAHEAGQRILEGIRAAGLDYDRATAHGRLQGADFWRLDGRTAAR